MATFTTKIVKDNIGHLSRMLYTASGSGVEWGILKEAGIHPKAKMPVANLQAIHEFRQDEWRRPLFHIQAAKLEDDYLGKFYRPLFKEYVEAAAQGSRVQIKVYFNMIGERMVKDASSMYGKHGIFYRGMKIPSNTEATKKLKGHDKPLLELKVLKKSVKFRTYRKM